jgi:hypothetical protein
VRKDSGSRLHRRNGRRRGIAIGFLLLIAAWDPNIAEAQSDGLPLSGYLLNVGVGSAEGPFSQGSVSDLQRVRLMTEFAFEDIQFDIAYEHLFNYFSNQGLNTGLGTTSAGASGLWMDLQGTVTSSDEFLWTHKVDRLTATYTGSDAFEATVGRQSISWATTFIFNPADPFVPFDPQDPFREYRAGIDAIRMKVFPSALTELDFVVRPTDHLISGTSLTALGRIKTVLGGWEIGGWAGLLYDEAGASASLTGDFSGTSLRSEFSFRDVSGKSFGRWSIGLDHNFLVDDHDLYAIVEYQFDGFGAEGPEEFVTVVLTPRFLRGELQVLSKHTGALQVSYQPHPLVSTGLLTMISLTDGSALLVPSIGYSAGSELSMRAGAFLGIGEETTLVGLPASEFGATPASFYVSVSTFF